MCYLKRKVIIFHLHWSWNASPAALALGSAGALPSDATAPLVLPARQCSRQSDLNVGYMKEGWLERNSHTFILSNLAFPFHQISLLCYWSSDKYRRITLLPHFGHTNTHRAAIQMNEHLIAGYKIQGYQQHKNIWRCNKHAYKCRDERKWACLTHFAWHEVRLRLSRKTQWNAL